MTLRKLYHVWSSYGVHLAGLNLVRGVYDVFRIERI